MTMSWGGEFESKERAMNRLRVVVPVALLITFALLFNVFRSVGLSLVVGGGRAVVILGVGHADLQTVPARIAGGRVSFQVPGRPTPLAFDARLKNGRLLGTVKDMLANGLELERKRTGGLPTKLGDHWVVHHEHGNGRQ